MRAAVLGCGPAGLFAAKALTDLGAGVDIYSKPRKSYMRGAQYLHRPIPGFSGVPFALTYDLEGTVEGYRDKVYGDTFDIPVSPQTLVGTAEAWDIREAYDAAWDMFGGRVIDWRPLDDDKNRGGMYGLLNLGYDWIISTIPAPALCFNPEHSFRSEKIWATDFIKSTGIMQDKAGRDIDNLVVCSGEPDDWWYRISRIQGWENTEYPHDRKPVTDRVWEVTKPISTDCDCWVPEVHRIGRYGEWRKGVLSHSAYYRTMEALS